jgi:hypothetical protein
MTANLRTAIEQLLLRPDEGAPAEQAPELLRARLVADFSEAIEGGSNVAGADSQDDVGVDDDQFLNDVAVYLEGRSSPEDRESLR